MNWVKTIPAANLTPGDREVVQVAGQAVLLVNFNGDLHAVDNACPHLRLPLNRGKITDDCAIVCPWHRSAFDLQSGDVKTWSPWPPGVGKLLGTVSREKALPVYQTKVEDGTIFVGIE